MTTDLSYLVGFLAGDGCFSKSCSQYIIGLWTPYPLIATRFAEKLRVCTGISPAMYVRKDRKQVCVKLSSKVWFERLLPLRDQARRGFLVVDDEIPFVKGLFDAEGCLHNPSRKNEAITISNASLPLLHLVRTILSGLGIETTGPHPGAHCFQIYVRKASLPRFKSLIGTDKPHKGITERVA